ncbi:hypothetical protein SSYM_2358, partial [Serratia symbiotica str. Tucson]
GNGPLKHVV